MKKVIIIGCPGSGKSTFARKLAEKSGLPLFHLDLLYWNSDKTTASKDVFRERLNNILIKDEWIIDGNYGSTMELRISACDTVFFLDYDVDVCLSGINERKGKPRPDMPWIETEDDEEFLQFIRDYNANSRPKVIELLNKYSNRDIFIFKNRNEAEIFIENIG